MAVEYVDGLNYAKLAEKLREEVRRRTILEVSHPELHLLEINTMIEYRGKLYITVGPAGEFYEFDGETVKLAYRSPYSTPSTDTIEHDWRGAFWVAKVYRGKLYFGGFKPGRPSVGQPGYALVISFDGNEWRVEKEFPDPYGEVFGMEVFKGYLYVGYGWTDAGVRKGKLWRFDGSAWTPVWETPSPDYGRVTALARVKIDDSEYLYVAVGHEGAATPAKIFRSTDGATFTLIQSFSNEYDFETNGLTQYLNRVYASTIFTGHVYVSDSAGLNFKLSGIPDLGAVYPFDPKQLIHCNLRRGGQMLLVCLYNASGQTTITNRGAVYAIVNHVWHKLFDSFDGICSAAYYKGRYYFGTCAYGWPEWVQPEYWNYRGNAVVYEVWPWELKLRREFPLTPYITSGQTIGAGATLYFPSEDGLLVSHYKHKTWSLLADYGLQYTIQVNDGVDWRDYYTATLTANVYEAKSTEELFERIRVKVYNPDTVSHTLTELAIKGWSG